MQHDLMEELKRDRVIAIVREQPAEMMCALADALLQGGVRFMEVAFRQDAPDTWPATARCIGSLSARYGARLRVGAGTVMRLEQLEMARDAGAAYIISPDADPDLIRATKRMGLLSFPGAFTATEIARAYACGADAVKVFPAGRLGPEYIRDLRAPLRHIPMMAIGGVNEKNAGRFIAAGCMAVGAGGSLVRADLIRAGAFDAIAGLAREYVMNCSAGKETAT